MRTRPTRRAEVPSGPSRAATRGAGRFGLVAAVALLAGACASPPATPPGAGTPLPFDLGRVQQQSQGPVTIELAIPTEADVAARFGAGFAEHGIQPIWLRIANDGDADLWLLPIAIDADYYSADEAALVAGTRLPAEDRAQLRERLRAEALPLFHSAGATSEGFVYASHVRGGRYVDVQLTGYGHRVRTRFAVLLPTEGFDYERSPLRALYSQVDQYPDLALDACRVRLRELPCCTSDDEGQAEGDPLNVVLVGRGETAMAALSSGGWTFTEAITADSVRRMVGAAIAEQSMLTAPVSSLYAFGRRQDIALQRGRSSISQRNHMRLWLAPFRCEGQPVWIGQVSRDIGVKMTRRSPTLTTHVIDPVVDESREYLLHSLLYRDAVARFAFVSGVGAATHEQPRRNLTGDPYITDGTRLVVWLSEAPVPAEAAVNLGWRESTDPVREGKGEEATVPVPER
jgi:hypothetical protein